MEGNYSIEVVEVMCANETDGNAQVTSPISVQTVVPDTQDYQDYEPEPPRKRKRNREESVMQTTAATNWILFGILGMIFLFMIFKCD